jgi:hypothetical protein
MLALTAMPADVWQQPVNDAVYEGFDRNLMYTSNGGPATVDVTAGSIDMTARPTSTPSVNLATTLLKKLGASLDVVVLENAGAVQPLRIGAWSPWTGTGFFVVFGPAPQDLITAQTIEKGAAGATLGSGLVLNSKVLGSYQLGTSYHVSILVDRSGGSITSSVSGDDGVKAEASIDSRHFPAIFGNVQLSLTASAAAGVGTSHAVLRNYSLTLPHERWWASRVVDPKAEIMLISLGLAGILLLGIKIVTRIQRGFVSRLATVIRGTPTALRLRIATRSRALTAMIGAVCLYLVGNALLFPLGGHPFDMGFEKLYAYVARNYGPDQLYYLPNVVSLAKIWSGVPYVESAFPYEPTFAYLFAGIGWLYGLVFAAGGTFSPNSVGLEHLIKAVNVLFGLLDSALIYLILRRLRVSERWSLVAGALFLFNPAVWFSMSVWGQTHVISLFFVLAAVLLAEKHLPLWAWLALTAACLTRPQMLVFALVIGIVFLRKFSWTENLVAMSWTVIVTFIVLAPLTFATSPSLPVDIMLNNVRIQQGGGNAVVLTTVSQDAYSIWPLVTYLVDGASGQQRAFTPSSTILVGPLSYQRLSQILTLAALLFVSAALLFRKRAAIDSGGYLPLVALGIASFLMLLTGVVATHFLLALPFLLLCRRWMGTVAYLYAAVIWTVTTLVPMFGDMGIVISSHDYPLLARDHNAITRFFVGLYTWDRFITVGIVANLCALVWLASLTFRRALPAAADRPASI